MAEGFCERVTRELKGCGFAYWKPAKGSHEKWRNDVTGKILIIPKNMKSRHTANGILRDAGGSARL